MKSVPVEIEMLGGARPPRVHYLRTAPDGQLVRKNPRQDMLWEYLRGPDGELVDPWTDGLLFALGGPIYAGTNEVQRNIIAERLLGLPKDGVKP